MTWEKRLFRARKVGAFARIDKQKVGSWPTCAIGERFHIKGIGLPDYVPSVAEKLGLDFMHAVKADDVYVAVRLYDEIQRAKRK